MHARVALNTLQDIRVAAMPGRQRPITLSPTHTLPYRDYHRCGHSTRSSSDIRTPTLNRFLAALPFTIASIDLHFYDPPFSSSHLHPFTKIALESELLRLHARRKPSAWASVGPDFSLAGISTCRAWLHFDHQRD